MRKSEHKEHELTLKETILLSPIEKHIYHSISPLRLIKL